MKVTQDAEQSERVAVLIVTRPDGWIPTSLDDLPPGVEIHYQPNPEAAKVFAENFNRIETQTGGSGCWAIH